MHALGGSDLRAVLDGAYDLLAITDADELPGAMLEVTRGLVPCESASYNEIDLGRGTVKIVVSGCVPPDREEATAFAEHAFENPLVAYQSSTGDGVPRRLSDFVTVRQFRRRPVYALVYRAQGIEAQLGFGLEQSGLHLVGMALNRGGADFSERDVAVIETLRPLLARIRLSLMADETLPQPLAREAEAARLTPRQQDVMSLLVRGATNRQIAARLVISERTVAKHLEHAFNRLGVTNRTAAVAAWRHLLAAAGPSPEPGPAGAPVPARDPRIPPGKRIRNSAH